MHEYIPAGMTRGRGSNKRKKREGESADGIKTGKFSPPRNCYYSRSIYERDISRWGGGLVREEDAPTKETDSGRFEFTVARRGKLQRHRGFLRIARAIYRGFINSNSAPDSLHRFVLSTWIVIDSSLIQASLEIIRGSVKELLLSPVTFFLQLEFF